MIDEQFYPDGIKGWMTKVDAKPGGGIELDPKFFVEWADGANRCRRALSFWPPTGSPDPARKGAA